MKKIAYIGSLGLLGIITTEFGVIGILPQIADYYHIPIEKAGTLLSAFALVIALAGPLMTLWLSGINRKTLMAVSISIFLITGVVSSLSPPFWLLLVVRMLPAFLQPVYISTAIAAATGAAHKKDAHKMMAIVLSGISLATVTTIPLATWLAGIYNSWQLSFVVQTVVSAVALIAIIAALPSMPATDKPSYGTQLKILTRPSFLACCAMIVCMTSAMFTTYSYFADYLGKVNSMSPNRISIMLLLFGAAGVPGNFLAGKLLSRSVKGAMAASLVAITSISVGIYYSPLLSVPLIIVWGLLHTPCFLTGQAYMIEAAPEAPGFANSLSISFGNLGVSLGTAVSGWVITTLGIHQAPWAMLAFGILALLLMGIKEVLAVKERRFVVAESVAAPAL
ncbi:MFS transporter [Chitinophaga arvensicola]|nr:MFS transporter [Chitinophaga arvensicola]